MHKSVKTSLKIMDPYPRQYQKELQPCNSFNLNRPFNPTAPAFDSSPNSKNTTLSFKIFQHPHENIPPFPKKFQIPLSLSLSPLSLPLPSLFLSYAQNPFLSLSPPKSLFLSSHPPTTLVCRQIAPLLWGRMALTSSESSKLSGTLSFSLYPSLPHSFSHLTSLIS
jgi:hypothetical protein